MISGDEPILEPHVLLFAKLLSDGKEPTAAYKESHPWSTAKPNSMAQMAYQLSKNQKVREQVTILQEAVRLQIIAEAPAAFILRDLAERAAKGRRLS